LEQQIFDIVYKTSSLILQNREVVVEEKGDGPVVQ